MRTTARSMELRRERTGLIDQCRRMLDLADAAARNLTGQETSQYDQLEARINALTGQIDQEEASGSPSPVSGGSERRERLASLEGDNNRRLTTPILEGGSPSREARRTDGFLTRSQSFAEAVRALPGHREPDGEPFSLGRFLRAAVTGEWRDAQNERRALMEGGNDVLGGYLLPETVSADMIDLARTQAVLFEAGALTRPMTAGNEPVPRLDSDPVASWKLEGVEQTSTSMNLGRVNLRARTLMAIMRGSVELFEDSAPNDLESIARTALSKSMALEVDRVGLRGTGVGAEPVGLRNGIAGDGGTVSELGSGSGDFLDLDDMSVLASTVEAQNFTPTALIWHPTIAGRMARVKDGDGAYQLAVNLPANLENVKRLSTTAIPITLTVGGSSACSEVYVGDFAQMAVCPRTQIKIEVLREGSVDGWSSAAGLGVVIRAYLRADILIRRGSAFVVQTGVKAS